MPRAKLGDNVEDQCSAHYDTNAKKYANAGMACCYLCACPLRVGDHKWAWVAVGPKQERRVFVDAATPDVDAVKVGSSCLRRVPKASILKS
jgi:hypothetical protein